MSPNSKPTESETHCDAAQLRSAIQESLDPARQARLEEHLAGCANCQSQIESMASDAADWQVVKDSLSSASLNGTGDGSGFHVIVDPDAVSGSNAATSETRLIESWLDPSTHPETLGSIDGFEVEQRIGRGGMGVVYRGFDRDLNRPVAIKFLAPHLAANGVARRRFAREAQAAAAVVHPNVVPIHSVNSSPERPYLVMALVAGRSLQKHVEDHGPLPVIDIVRVAQQIAAGLAAAHEQGLIHRDIKPANIMLENDVSRVMITDFGLARAADDAALTQSGWLAGTPHYMSPEQAKGEPIDMRSDLFSLGSVIYFMATGREPFRAEKSFAVLQKIGGKPHASIRSINNQIPRTLEQIVDSLMDKSPSRRIQSATEANLLLTDYVAHLQNPTTMPEPRSPAKARSQRRILWSLLSMLLVVGSVALALQYLAWWMRPIAGKSTSAPTLQTTNGLPSAPPTGMWPQESPSFAARFDDELTEQLTRLERDISRLETTHTMQYQPSGSDSLSRTIDNLDAQIRQLETNNLNFR